MTDPAPTTRPGSGSESTVSAAITERPISGAEILSRLGGTGDGAVLLFEGRVRNLNEGRPVARLRYEAYREMAEKELESIAREVAGRYEIGEVLAVHRVGSLTLGEVSVAIAVSAPHRDACYQASRAIMEEIKARLPVWKYEEYTDGEGSWLGV